MCEHSVNEGGNAASTAREAAWSLEAFTTFTETGAFRFGFRLRNRTGVIGAGRAPLEGVPKGRPRARNATAAILPTFRRTPNR
jgi:hypothetical protein